MLILGNMKVQYRITQQFRLPKEICDWLQNAAKKTGKTKTRIVEEALRALIGK